MKSKSCNRILMLAALLAVIALAAATMNYHLANTYKFGAAAGGGEYFDYITLGSRIASRLFVIRKYANLRFRVRARSCDQRKD